MLKVNGAVISMEAFAEKYGMAMGTDYGWAAKTNDSKSSEIRLEENGTVRLAGIRDCDEEKRENDGWRRATTMACSSSIASIRPLSRLCPR
jgi:predicted RNA-binding protein